jgi:hypothetical protein
MDDELMRRIFPAILASLILWGAAALAQMQSSILWDASQSSYVGPGDLVPGASVWFGLHAYTNAIAHAGTQVAFDVLRQNDAGATLCSPTISTAGNVDVTSATPCGGQTVTNWAGTNGTCTGSIATTVLTVTSCSSGSLAIFDNITGAGVTANTFITSLGTGTGGAGTYNLNNSQTVASETLTATPSKLRITEWKDQTGGNNNIGAAGAPGSLTNTPELKLTGCHNPSLPCIWYDSTRSLIKNTSLSTDAQPYSYSAVAEYDNGGTSVNAPILYSGTVCNNYLYITENGAPGFVAVNSGAAFGATAAADTLHAFNALISNASSVINVNGTETTGTAGSHNTCGPQIQIGNGAGVSVKILGEVNEVGRWSIGFTSGQRAALCHNQRGRYSIIGGSC